MPRKLSEELRENDHIAVALRGGAGWVAGTIVWIRDEQMLVKHAESALGSDTPYVLIDLGEITGVAIPREIEPPVKPSASTGFLRG